MSSWDRLIAAWDLAGPDERARLRRIANKGKPGRKGYLRGRRRREGKAPQVRAIGFIQDARMYWEAATLLESARRDPLQRAYMPTYQLLAHAIELAIKAHLSSFGVKPARLTRLGHDLELGFRYARRWFAFRSPDMRFPELVQALGLYHRDHVFRYRLTGAASFPLPAVAADIIEPVISAIEPRVRARYAEFKDRQRRV